MARRKDPFIRVAIFLVVCLVVSLGINLFFLVDSVNQPSSFSSNSIHQQVQLQSLPKVQDHSREIDVVKISDHNEESHGDTPADLAGSHDAVPVLSTAPSKPDVPDKVDRVKDDLVQQAKPETNSSLTSHYRLAGLSCTAHGGPADEIAAEMIYWRDIPSDAEFTSPFYNEHEEEKFLLWDVDPAGFNNKRLSFENFVLLAHAMGRTLVMPPKGIWWGMSNSKNNTLIEDRRNKPRWSMEDFYDVHQMAVEQAGFKVISMETFLQQHAMQGKLIDRITGKSIQPPKGMTDWNGVIQKALKMYLEKVTVQITWRPEDCLGAFPSENTDRARKEMDSTREQILKAKVPSTAHWINNPTNVNATLHDRMEEIITNRKSLCFYSPEQQSETYLYYKILYDARNHTLAYEINIRLLIYFYCWMIFQDWHHDLWAKRFIRDHLRYKDELQCAAARIVHKLRTVSKTGDFDVLHIRRHGEFESQYGALPSAEEILSSISLDIKSSDTVYIATDEPNRTFFDPLFAYFDKRPYFLNDFLDLIPNLDTNYYSIMDQLVATRGRKFFGAFCSTFTGYINRMRGYHSTKSKWKDYENGGLVDSFFYNFNKEGKRDKMRKYHPPVASWFFREYPIAWRDIDHDVIEQIVS